MKANMITPFSFSVLDSEYFNDNLDKIEIVKCFRKEMKCKEHLVFINENYLKSDLLLREKDYIRSIEKLKSAFYKTLELKDVQCKKCLELFRDTITDSLKDIKSDLAQMTSGFFGNKHYMPSYILVDNVLQELEKVSLCSTIEPKKAKEHFIGSYLKKSVS